MTSHRAAAALLCGALALLPGCGSSGSKGKIPASDSDRMVRAIGAADAYSAAGRCNSAHKKVGDARYLLGQLPASVDRGLRQNLADGLNRLDSLIDSECARTQTHTQTTQSQTTPTTQSQPTTTPTQTTPTVTQTTPTTTTPTTTTPTSTTPTTTTPTSTNGGTGAPNG